MEKLIRDIAEYAGQLGLWAPRFTRHEGKTLMISALPCGRGKEARPDSGHPVGSIAAFAQKNYYRELVERLRRLLRLRRGGEEPAGARIFCNSRLPEKDLAVRAGLGVQGKNSLIIIPGAGSLFVLGGIVFPHMQTRENSAPDCLPADQVCGGCDACIRACPTGAIRKEGGIDPGLCIQAFTAEERPVPPEVRKKWGITLYGCRICQEACPHNARAPQAAETAYGHIGPAVALEPILSCPAQELRKTLFRGTVLDMSWISPIALKRGALFAAAHQKAPRLLPLIKDHTRHEHPLLREASRHALNIYAEHRGLT
ncbi:MAG: iron-sulfur protein [Spirochaetales bacterium]|jgi:epoxyqueuosine reductase|nr:iron-sulfur protein [Spirochaetales bacterium]